MKFLVPDRLAGVIIGKGGSGIAELEQETGANMRLSGARVYFPGTTERVMVCGGESEAVKAILPILLQKLNDPASGRDTIPSGRDANCVFRFVLTNSACSCIIGKGGEVIKALSAQSGASIRASDRAESHHERIVEVKGSAPAVAEAAWEIVSRVQEDAAFREFASVLNYETTSVAPQSAYYYGGLAAAAGAAGAQAAALRGPSTVVDHYPIAIEFGVPAASVGAIIGKNGEARNRIVHATGANLVVSDRQSDPLAERKISLSGPLAAVQAALTLVAKLIVESQ